MDAMHKVNALYLRVQQLDCSQNGWMRLTKHGSWSIVTGKTGLTHP